jgi:predicted nucleic acid-binding protein
LTVYDAIYLDLAQRRTIALGTLDRELIRAAKAESVALLQYFRFR